MQEYISSILKKFKIHKIVFVKYSLGRVPAPYDGVFRQEKVGILHKLFACQLCENGSECAAKFSIVTGSVATVNPHNFI